MLRTLKHALVLRLVKLVPNSSVSLLLGFSAIGLLLEVCTIMCLGVKRHLASGHEISR